MSEGKQDNNRTELSKKMLAIADRDNLPVDHEMRLRAKEFDESVNYYGDGAAKKLLGAWVRARKAYCRYTGEPLL